MGVVEWGVRNQRIRVRKLRRGGDKQRELAWEGNKEQLEGYKNHAFRSQPINQAVLVTINVVCGNLLLN